MELTLNPASDGTESPKVMAGTVIVTLKDGRSIGIRKMGPMHQMRLGSIIGAENSKNELYRSLAVPAYSTVSIDGVAVPTPQTVLALESIAERLGDVALLEITLAIVEHFPEADMSGIVDEFKKRQEIKNS